MLVRTLIASCDIPGCSTVAEMNDETSQPYRSLAESGWRMENYPNQILTICPLPHPAP